MMPVPSSAPTHSSNPWLKPKAEGDQKLVFRFDGERELVNVLQQVQMKSNLGSIKYYHHAFENTGDLRVQIIW